MPDQTSITCPVCGRATGKGERCSFCGSCLEDTGGRAVPGGERSGDVQAQDSHLGYPRGAGWQRSYGPPPYPYGSPAPGLVPRYAGFWIRLVAYSIDSILVQIGAAIIIVVSRMGYTAGLSAKDTGGTFLSFLLEMDYNVVASVILVLNLVYFTFFLSRTGQTLGKKLCGLKVVDADGHTITAGRACLRTVCLLVTLCVFSPATLWIAIDRRKQGLHDKIASTYEVRHQEHTVYAQWSSPQAGGI